MFLRLSFRGNMLPFIENLLPKWQVGDKYQPERLPNDLNFEKEERHWFLSATFSSKPKHTFWKEIIAEKELKVWEQGS